MNKDVFDIFSASEQGFKDAVEQASAVARVSVALAGEGTASAAGLMGNGAALAGALWTARDWREAAELQSRYAAKTYQDYMSGTTRMAALWIDLAKCIHY
jgi:hypothetical protein